MDIRGYRDEIDKIDRELVKLFEKRMNVVGEIAKYKELHNMKILNIDREIEVIEKNINRLDNKNYEKLTEKFFSYLMKLSRSYQKDLINIKEKSCYSKDYEVDNIDIRNLDNIKIGYQGVKGSFTEEAMIKYFGDKHYFQNFDEFEDVFMALKNNEIDYGILPIENSFTGSISEVYDLLVKYGFYIIGEESIKIEQNLVGIPGAQLEDIKEIYSHAQGFEQSRNFLNNCNDIIQIPYHNTAMSAEYVSKQKDKSKGAIASARAAKIYGLDIIKEKINDKDDNTTKFIIIGKKLIKSKDNDKITVVFSLDNKAGTLYKFIKHFAENNVNMVKIESRPTKNEPWEYLLYIDFEGDIETNSVRNLIELIDENSDYFKVLGCYKKI